MSSLQGVSERASRTVDGDVVESIGDPARRRRVLIWLVHAGIAVTMILIWTETLSTVLPAGLARRVAFNSEGLFFGGVLAAWIQFGIPAAGGARRVRIWSAGAAATCLALGVVLTFTDLPSRFKTLSESALALAFAIPYVSAGRPVRRWVPTAPILVVLVIALVAGAVGGTDWLVREAELIGLLILLPIGLDVIDPGILDPTAITSRPIRMLWYVVLAAEVIVVSAAGTSVRSSGEWYSDVLDYLGRSHEAVIGVLLVQLFFAVGLGRTGATTVSRTRS